ncbi:DnaJ-domain-containing protein [Coprinopsis marcescibilis]|uniref:DnaJ-domain-containing protein n=1 Tax=Coprinopsis marcescibilis TaxID=230819 RepID=A0A5C3L0V5_COPMA|nr:DnaJ-domain-containing protein [Coprinopsis marcescibilis]
MSTYVEEETSPYEILELGIEATEQEIKTSYRKRSLKVHPDRNPNNPDAARKFHELNQAYELLLDPLRRLALDAKLRVKLARTQRFKAYDTKRKNLVEELEERESAFKKAKFDRMKEEVEAQHQTERIKEEGRKLREERERNLREREKEEYRKATEQETKMDEDVEEPPPLDQFDTTVRLKYSLKVHPELTSKESIAAYLLPFGAVDVASVVFSLKTKSKSKPKASDSAPTHATALVPFKTIGDAYAAVCASPASSKVDLKGMEITWVNNKEPLILGWLKNMGKLPEPGANTSSQPVKEANSSRGTPLADAAPSSSRPQTTEPTNPFNVPAGSTPFSSFPDLGSPPHQPPTTPAPSFSFSSAPGLDYESLTLLRLRQAEKEKLEREIREREAEED